MNRLKQVLWRLPVIGTVLLFVLRFFCGARYFLPPLKELLVWLFRSRETANFTYDLTETNRRYLASLIADITRKPYAEIEAYMAELEDDTELRAHIHGSTLANGEKAITDFDVRYGRRLGWYAFARAMKPQVIVETGVDKGLGSCVLTAALRHNRQDGRPGYYYGTDINPHAGYLLHGKYREYGEILYGDSLASLSKLDAAIDLFVNDSDHSAAYERQEYQLVSSHFSPQAIILADNAHCTTELLDFALTTQRQFIFFREQPSRHWYPGAGIGIAFQRELQSDE